MNERKTYHRFSLKKPFPSYINSIDNVGNKCVEIELVDALCITEGRIATDFFKFFHTPDFSIMNPMTDEFIDEYFKLMQKLALCFEFVSLKNISRLLKLRRNASFYPISFPEHLRYPDVKGFMEMQYGPMLMLVYYIMRHKIAAGEDTAQGRRAAHRFVKRIMQRMEPIIMERNRLHGYYVKGFNQLRKRKSCGPMINRAAKEKAGSSIPSISINGLSFVLEEDVKSESLGYLAQYPYNIREVRGMGTGVALLDLISPIKVAFSSKYNFSDKIIPTKICSKCKKEKLITEFYRNRKQCNSCKDYRADPGRPVHRYWMVRGDEILDKQRRFWADNWGPLYPAILFKHEPEKLVRTIDLSFFR